MGESTLFGRPLQQYLAIMNLLDEHVPGDEPLDERLERLLMQEHYAGRWGKTSVGEQLVAERLRRNFEFMEKPTE